MKRVAIGLIAGLSWLATCPASGEVFVLTSGGRIEGEWVNRDEKPLRAYVVKRASGGQITLDASSVKEVIAPEAAPQTEYDKVCGQYPDTVEGQWALSEWCRDHKFNEQRKKHLARVLELDPDHDGARRVLGYIKIDGEWKTRPELMAKQGREFYKGEWLLPQEIKLREERDALKKVEAKWFGDIKRWRSWLGTAKDQQARQGFAGINDAAAVSAISRTLKEEQKDLRVNRPDVRTLLIDALARIGTPEAAKIIAICAIDDPDQEVRLTCLDHLEKKPNPEVVAYFVSRLQGKDKKNIEVVKRASLALGRMKDSSAIPVLIDHLIVLQKVQIGPARPAGSMQGTFSKDGNGPIGFNPGGGAPKVVDMPVKVQPVLDALVAITGQNYNFEPKTWKIWYQSQKKADTLDARRD
jgi:hypothetical protein